MSGSLQSFVLLGSLASLGVGFWMAWPPLGPIVIGTLLLAGLIWVRLTKPLETPKE
jgi:hypothetical protein